MGLVRLVEGCPNLQSLIIESTTVPTDIGYSNSNSITDMGLLSLAE